MPRPSFRPQVGRLDDRCLPAFLDPVSYAAHTTPHGVVGADFNNDGRPDLAVAANSSPSASLDVLLGNGDGTFQPAIASGPGSSLGSLAVGDFDRDGTTDLAAAESWSRVDLLRGNGDGTFTLSTRIDLGTTLASVAVGDFNGDGLLDLGVAATTVYSSEYGDFPYGYAIVLRGDGAGGLALASSTYLGAQYHVGAVVADLNGDAKLDFACTNSDYGFVEVLLGDGAGQLGGATYYGPSGSSVLAARDVDGDADADLVTAVSNRGVGVLRNDGAGGFGPAEIYPAGDTPSYVVPGDFNSDGRLDVADAGFNNNGAALLGLENGTYSPPMAVNIGPSSSATAGDFNGDGLLDLATTPFLGTNVTVLLNDHNWTLTPLPPTIAIGDATTTEGNTGTRQASFTVTLSAASDQPVTVAYATHDGSYATGSDYVAASGTLTIPAGRTTGTITVLVKGDRLGEPDESFIVDLDSPTNATIADGQGVGVIADDEPRISIGDVSKNEGGRGQTTLFTFTVTLSAAYDQPVTMSFRTVNGTAKTGDNDYVARTGTLTFAPGETTKTITITVRGDSKKESDETFYLDLFGLSSNGLFARNRGVGTILNDD